MQLVGCYGGVFSLPWKLSRGGHREIAGMNMNNLVQTYKGLEGASFSFLRVVAVTPLPSPFSGWLRIA